MQSWRDFEQVNFMRRVTRATYNPAGHPGHDVTGAVQGLIGRGQMQVNGGIHTAIGDPFPGQPKIFTVWYV